MIKYCSTCRLRDKQKKVCLLFGVPMEDRDYCSKHADEIILCDICGNPLLGPTYVEDDGDEKLLRYCERCHQAFQTCQLCSKMQECEFETNPDPMPKIVMKAVRQGNMMMQTQVKNEERVQKFCHSCHCWLGDGIDACGKEFNVSCYKNPRYFS